MKRASGPRSAPCPLFVESGIEARRLEIGEAKDPDEFVQKLRRADALEACARPQRTPLLDLVPWPALPIARFGAQHRGAPSGTLWLEVAPHPEARS